MQGREEFFEDGREGHERFDEEEDGLFAVLEAERVSFGIGFFCFRLGIVSYVLRTHVNNPYHLAEKFCCASVQGCCDGTKEIVRNGMKATQVATIAKKVRCT